MTERELSDEQKVLRGVFSLVATVHPKVFMKYTSLLASDDPMKSVAQDLIRDMTLPARIEAQGEQTFDREGEQ